MKMAKAPTKAIITLEEHCTYGGLGEAVAHITSEFFPVPLKILGFPEEVVVGKPHELFAHYGLTKENIAETAIELLR